MTDAPNTVGEMQWERSAAVKEDWATDERTRRLYQRQRDFGRSCFYLSAGFFLLAGIIIYNYLR